VLCAANLGVAKFVQTRHHRKMRDIAINNGFHFSFADRFDLARRCKLSEASRRLAVDPFVYDLFYATRSGVRHYVFTFAFDRDPSSPRRLVYTTESCSNADTQLQVHRFEPSTQIVQDYVQLLSTIPPATAPKHQKEPFNAQVEA